jgi:colanic acid biosynthesis glycosyl transferase WcaI
MRTAGKPTREAERNGHARFATKAHSNFAITKDDLKILYISQYFPPEMGAPAARVSELSQYWAGVGHEVTVLTGFPNHPDGVIRPEYRRQFRRMVHHERVGPVRIVRSWLLPFPNRKPYERILNYGSFFASAGMSGLFLEQPDVVIATSPQLLVGLSGWWVSKFKRARFVLEVRDLWPESLVAVGIGDTESMSYRILQRIAGFLYRKADQIVVVTPAFREYLVRHWQVPEEKVSLVTNGVDTRLFAPRDPCSDVARTLGLEDKFVVSFIGTIGIAHGLETLIASAERLQTTYPDIRFMIIGDGAERERVMNMARAKNLRNISFVPQQSREKIPAYIASSNVCLVLLKKAEVFETVIPTKMLEYMSCARPVILGVGGQAKEIVQRARAGICIEPENASALCDAVLKLRADAFMCADLGRNGREYIVRNFSRERTAVDYLEVLTGIVNEGKSMAAAVA